MKDMIIDSCKWYVDENATEQAKQSIVETFRCKYQPLLRFFDETGLIRSEALRQIRDWENFEIKISDFTEEGLELIMLCHDRWLDAVERGSNPANIKLWEKELIKIRSDSPILLH